MIYCILLKKTQNVFDSEIDNPMFSIFVYALPIEITSDSDIISLSSDTAVICILNSFADPPGEYIDKFSISQPSVFYALLLFGFLQ